MTQIDFYVLRDEGEEARWRFAGRLADKARRLGRRIVIAVDSSEQAQALDDFLWHTPEDSFLPHRQLGANEQPEAAVEIAAVESLGDHQDVLINLSTTVPDAFARFGRLAEVVIQSPDILKNTREHFSFYKSQGYPVRHQQL